MTPDTDNNLSPIRQLWRAWNAFTQKYGYINGLSMRFREFIEATESGEIAKYEQEHEQRND